MERTVGTLTMPYDNAVANLNWIKTYSALCQQKKSNDAFKIVTAFFVRMNYNMYLMCHSLIIEIVLSLLLCLMVDFYHLYHSHGVLNVIIGVGSCNVGKTSLIKHFCESKFTSNYQPTVGVDYGFKVENINGCDVRVNIWDFSGNTDYLEVRNELYSKTNGIFLVFDVTNATTFESLDQWLREITQYSSNSAQIFIVGNKVDLKHTRSVNQNNLKKLLQNYKCQYFETSAATGEGVNDMFKAMLTTILSEKT